MDLEKLNRSPWGKERGKNSYKQRGREANRKRPLNTENKLRVAGGKVEGGWVKWVMGIKEGTFQDEHWVLYVSQLDNKLYLKNR